MFISRLSSNQLLEQSRALHFNTITTPSPSPPPPQKKKTQQKTAHS